LEGFEGCTSFTVFGELFGGMYPHKDVPKEVGTVHVQKGVYYCPNIRFYAFDIFVPGRSYLDWPAFETVCKGADLLYSKPLGRGCFDDLLKLFDIQTFKSTLPAQFGLPELENNVAEGVVLKPIKNTWMPKGGRVIIKFKSERFKEVSGVIKVPGPKKASKVHEIPECTDQEATLHLDNLKLYINENRLRAVRSKIANVKLGDRGKLTGLLAQDALKDYGQDVPGWLALDKEVQKLVTKRFQVLASNFVNQHIQAIADGSF